MKLQLVTNYTEIFPMNVSNVFIVISLIVVNWVETRTLRMNLVKLFNRHISQKQLTVSEIVVQKTAQYYAFWLFPIAF